MTYAIMVTETYSKREFELCRVGGHPERIVKALRGKRREITKDNKSGTPVYQQVRIVRLDVEAVRD